MQTIRLKSLDAILDGYLRAFPIAHALFRTAETRRMAGRELAFADGSFETIVSLLIHASGAKRGTRRMREYSLPE